MPSTLNGTLFSSLLTSTTSVSFTDEIQLQAPILDDDQTIITSSSAINLTYRIICPCLMFIGTCGSIMSLKCLYAQRFRKNNSTYVFFFFIALTDLAILYTGALRLLVLAFTGYDVRHTSLFMCRVHRFTTYFLLQLSSVLLTLMTLDRARRTLSMLPPSKLTVMTLQQAHIMTSDYHSAFRSRARQSKLLWITCLVILGLLLIDSHFFYCTGYYHNINKGQLVCQAFTHNAHCQRYWLSYLWIDGFLYSYLPFIIITICNIRLIIYLKQQRARRIALTSSTTHLSHNHRVTCSVVLMSALFLILVVPVAFLEQFEYYLNHYKYFQNILAITYLGMYFNHTISFFLFLFGTQFRQSVKELIWAQASEPARTNTTLFAIVQYKE